MAGLEPKKVNDVNVRNSGDLKDILELELCNICDVRTALASADVVQCGEMKESTFASCTSTLPKPVALRLGRADARLNSWAGANWNDASHGERADSRSCDRSRCEG